ncbi:13766_t:CDS:2 [Funneliformis caledonium]|uniref:13766_t:CDS:1 n=2 Tax=Funneliformis TaxID=1117308 RepID=A0A9N8ZU63_9GLOM|nr:2744_t:CDS:2 [Funneliformis mosseae]CAG8508322.1 13766_t:CDS:2 [Funneliformis caledonium]
MADPYLCSLSQCIINDIKLPDGTFKQNVLGGGGVYATYGMRLWFSSPESQRIAYSFHAGYDFPISILQKLLSLNISLTQIWHSNLPSIRGLATFTSADQRVFVYQTPPIGTVPADLPSSYLNSKIFHFICSSNWASQHITEILRLRDKQLPPPTFVWEPVPNSTTKENLQSCVEAMKMVDVLSPNHEEAAALLGLISEEDEEVDRFLSEDMLTYMADRFLSYQIGPHGNGCVVIRASYKGCLVATKEKKEIIPAYWTTLRDGTKDHHVIDVTGAGNAFCGGFMAGLIRSNYDVFEAALFGSVSASFTVEQLGAPRLEFNQNGNEIWNSGDDPQERLQKLRQRVKEKLKEKLKVKLKERIQEKLKNRDVNQHHHQNGVDTVQVEKDGNDFISDGRGLIDHENFRDSVSPAD